MSGATRVAVVTNDPVTAAMPGPAIRAWHMAEQLAVEHDVVLASTQAADRDHPAFTVRTVAEAGLRELEAWCDVLVFQGGVLRTFPFLDGTTKVLVADVYDPYHLESLEQTRGQPADERRATMRHLTGVLNQQLERCDLLLCASPRQRDFWMGSLAALGRVNPATYDHDPTLASLLAVVPFGVPAAPPARTAAALRGVVPGIGPDDKVVLWAGGVYNWFDPLTLVRAVDGLRRDVPAVRLFFLGMAHPNPTIPRMRVATELRDLADELGLTGTHVFFNEGWVDYDRRADYLREADVGVTTHLDHVETAYSSRTRILDYLWAGLPVVATAGDGLADLVSAGGAGRTVRPGDVEGLRRALHEVLTDDAVARGCAERSRALAAGLTWDQAMAPLVEFCRHPHRAADRPSPAPAPAPAAAPPGGGAGAREREAARVARRVAATVRRLVDTRR